MPGLTGLAEVMCANYFKDFKGCDSLQMRLSCICIDLCDYMYMAAWFKKASEHVWSQVQVRCQWAYLAHKKRGLIFEHPANPEDFLITLFLHQPIYLRSHPSIHPCAHLSIFPFSSAVHSFSISRLFQEQHKGTPGRATQCRGEGWCVKLFAAVMCHMFHCVLCVHGWVEVRDLAMVAGFNAQFVHMREQMVDVFVDGWMCSQNLACGSSVSSP